MHRLRVESWPARRRRIRARRRGRTRRDATAGGSLLLLSSAGHCECERAAMGRARSERGEQRVRRLRIDVRCGRSGGNGRRQELRERCGRERRRDLKACAEPEQRVECARATARTNAELCRERRRRRRRRQRWRWRREDSSSERCEQRLRL